MGKEDGPAILTAAGLCTVLGMLIPWMNQMIFQEVIPAGQVNMVFSTGFLLLCCAVSPVLFSGDPRIFTVSDRDQDDDCF